MFWKCGTDFLGFAHCKGIEQLQLGARVSWGGLSFFFGHGGVPKSRSFTYLIPRIQDLLDYRDISFGRYEISSQGLGESLLFYARDGKSQPKVGN